MFNHCRSTGCRGGWLPRNLTHVAQSPVHTLGGARLTVNHDLRGAARTVLARQIDAFLNRYDVVVSVEVPDIPVRQQQHRTMTICQAAGASSGMKMEPDRKLILCVRRQRVVPVTGRKTSSPSSLLPSDASATDRSFMI